jgi:hypothetical protein
MATDATVTGNHLDQGDVRVTVTPFGPSDAQLADLGARVVAHRAVRGRFTGGKARLLYIEALEDEDQATASSPQPPTRFRATIWDGSQQCAVRAEGGIDDLRSLTVTELAAAPPPSREEFDEAVELVRRDQAIGPAVRDGGRLPYRPIPAVQVEQLPDGGMQRRIAVGLIPRRPGERHEIVAVDLDRGRIHRAADAAGAGAPAVGLCGVPVDAEQRTASKGTAGQAIITVSQGGHRIWRFLVARPAASSGTNGSGIELRHVHYRGKRVLRRAHVPILNVKYDGNACGPYRDWQFEEGKIRAHGADVAPGFRLCPTPAKTIMDTGSDTGNYLGVAVYLRGDELVLVSEMQAGWYRYVSEWGLGLDGVIKPRFGFAAVESECVCNVHHHHAYWRFDFAIRTSAHNRLKEFNDPPLPGSDAWQTLKFETRRPRSPAHSRRWRIGNTQTEEAYDIHPGPNDGVASTQPDAPFGRGDLWVLRYHSNRIDDGVEAIGPPYEAGLNAWLNGESITDHDLVVWYGAHFTHDVHEAGPAEHGHIVGPDLRPVRWS